MQNAIICDLDGTLFECEWRRKLYLPNFTEFHKHHTKDKIKTPILEILKRFQSDHKIIIVSGRDDRFKQTTEQQLNQYLKDYILLMRKYGDFRSDDIFKQEIYDQHIKNQYNILFVLDDREKVVKMWRKNNLTCLQSDFGNF